MTGWRVNHSESSDLATPPSNYEHYHTTITVNRVIYGTPYDLIVFAITGRLLAECQGLPSLARAATSEVSGSFVTNHHFHYLRMATKILSIKTYLQNRGHISEAYQTNFNLQHVQTTRT